MIKIPQHCLAGNRVVFHIIGLYGVSESLHGTAMTGLVNGLVLVAVHDRFAEGCLADKNFLPVVAVREAAILAIDDENVPQGNTP